MQQVNSEESLNMKTQLLKCDNSQIKNILNELNQIAAKKKLIDAKREGIYTILNEIEEINENNQLDLQNMDYIYINPSFGQNKPQIIYQTYETLIYEIDSQKNECKEQSNAIQQYINSLDRRIKQILSDDFIIDDNQQDSAELYEKYKSYSQRILMFMTNNVIKDKQTLNPQFIKEVKQYLSQVNNIYYTMGYVNIYNTHIKPYISEEREQNKQSIIEKDDLNYLQEDTLASMSEKEIEHIKTNFNQYKTSQTNDICDPNIFIQHKMYKMNTKQFSMFRSYDIESGRLQDPMHTMICQSNEHKIILPTIYGIIFEIVLLKNKSYNQQKTHYLTSDFKLNSVHIQELRQKCLQMQNKQNSKNKQFLLISRLYRFYDESLKYNVFGIQNAEQQLTSEYWVIGNNYIRQDDIQNGIKNRFLQLAESYKFHNNLFFTNNQSNQADDIIDENKQSLSSIQNDLTIIKGAMQKLEKLVYQLLCIVYQINSHAHNKLIQQQNIQQESQHMQ